MQNITYSLRASFKISALLMLHMQTAPRTATPEHKNNIITHLKHHSNISSSSLHSRFREQCVYIQSTHPSHMGIIIRASCVSIKPYTYPQTHSRIYTKDYQHQQSKTKLFRHRQQLSRKRILGFDCVQLANLTLMPSSEPKRRPPHKTNWSSP